MRGYSGIMTATDRCSIELHGNGEKVCFNHDVHELWSPPLSGATTPEPLWHLHLTVLRDQEARGDCPNRKFAFKSLHHLTHATNQLEAAFGAKLDLRKCGVDAPDAMGGRVNDGRSENITIEFDSDAVGGLAWKDFLAQLKTLEDEWDYEAISAL